MKKTLLIPLLLGATTLFAQQKDSILVKEIPIIKNIVFQQRQDIDALNKNLRNQEYKINQQIQAIETLRNTNKSLNASIDSLTQLIQINSQNIVTNSTELGTKIQQTGESADSKIASLDSNLSNNQLYWIIATLVLFLLGGLIYWLLGKRIQTSQTDVETQIKNTKAALDEESVKLDGQLVEVLSKQLEILKIDSEKIPKPNENDHSLVLKVADRLTAMETNHLRMDPNTPLCSCSIVCE